MYYLLQFTLEMILKQNNGLRANGIAVASQATQAKRRQVIYLFFKILTNELGFDLKNVKNLGNRHLIAVFQYWEQKGLKSLACHISIMKTFCTWIGKPEMVHKPEWYVKDKNSVRRECATRVDKSWEGNGIDVEKLISQIEQDHPRVGMVLRLQDRFGLRLKEAMLLKPYIADKSLYLHITLGTKNGKPRVNAIETAQQREVLDQAKSFVSRPRDSMVPRGQSFISYKNHFYYVLRQYGVTKKDLGIVSHGLRHGRLNKIYEKYTGVKSPVQGGDPDSIDRETDIFGRTHTSEEGGHSRPSIASAYCGAVKTKRTKSTCKKRRKRSKRSKRKRTSDK